MQRLPDQRLGRRREGTPTKAPDLYAYVGTDQGADPGTDLGTDNGVQLCPLSFMTDSCRAADQGGVDGLCMGASPAISDRCLDQHNYP